MCDYSLHAVSSRPAKIADKLVTTKFRHTLTRGFCAVGEPEVAVCLRPGTELVFEAEVQAQMSVFQMILSAFLGKKGRVTVPHRLGRFRQVELNDLNTHHDAIEFPGGKVALLTHLRPGQRATVLQLPTDTHQSPVQTGVQSVPSATRTPAHAY